MEVCLTVDKWQFFIYWDVLLFLLKISNVGMSGLHNVMIVYIVVIAYFFSFFLLYLWYNIELLIKGLSETCWCSSRFCAKISAEFPNIIHTATCSKFYIILLFMPKFVIYSFQSNIALILLKIIKEMCIIM